MNLDKFLWIAAFFSIGYFLFLRRIVDWNWEYFILGTIILSILLGLFFYGKKKEVKKV